MSEKLITRRLWIRKLKANLTIKDFPSVVNDIEVRCSKMATLSRLDLHDLYLELVIRGLKQAEKEYEELNEWVGQKNLDKKHKQLIALLDAQEEITERNKMTSDLMSVFKDKGVEAFELWCEDHSFDAREFYQAHQDSLSKLSWAKKARAWIKFAVDRLHEPMPLEDFISMAVDAGMIDENLSNKDAFYKHLQRQNVVGNPHGYVWDG